MLCQVRARARLCTRGALAFRSRLPCPRARMANVASLRPRIEAAVQARSAPEPALLPDLGCWYCN
eukprot:6180569-Pleurochrysis_carterae.AAC.4